MSVRAIAQSQVVVAEVLNNNIPFGIDKVIRHRLDDGKSFVADSVIADVVSLVAGTKTLDLTAIPGTRGLIADNSGKRLRRALIVALEDNVAPIEIGPDEEDGYELFGADGSVTLSPGQVYHINYDEISQTVSTQHKNILLTGNGTDRIKFIFVFGEGDGEPIPARVIPVDAVAATGINQYQWVFTATADELTPDVSEFSGLQIYDGTSWRDPNVLIQIEQLIEDVVAVTLNYPAPADSSLLWRTTLPASYIFDGFRQIILDQSGEIIAEGPNNIFNNMVFNNIIFS